MEKKRLLVVVDMQNDFITGVLGTAEAQTITNKVVDKINQYKRNGDYIVYTMDTHTEDYLSTQEGRKLPVKHCVYPSSGWQLNEAIAEALKGAKAIGSDHSLEYQKGIFGSWDLAEDLKKWEAAIDTIEFVGVCTGICVISNVVLAKTIVPEVPILVDASCCACVTSKSHETALDAMELLQTNIINR